MVTRKTHVDPDEILFKPVESSGRNFYITVFILGAIVILAVIAYIYQLNAGLTVTGMSRQVFWGVYITDFVFFIGISHAGALIVAVLRIVKAEWRRPISRCAELVTVVALIFGVLSIVLDLGRPDRLLNLVAHANLGSPLLWDICSVTVYLTASVVFLYIALIPDIGLLRDRGNKPKWFYQILSIGWEGTEKQKALLEKGCDIMSVVVILVAVSVHTVVSFVFVMTLQPMWHTAILAPYFVAGAIFTGIATIILAMALLRKVYHLEDYFKPVHFNNLGIFLLVIALFWFYFTCTEYLTVYRGAEPLELTMLWDKLSGRFAPHFWAMCIFCFGIPFPLLAFGRLRTIAGTSIASVSVIIGMWLERYTIIVPTLTTQRLSIDPVNYIPTWVEWSILAGCSAFLILLYILFTKVFPIVSIYEMREGREQKKADIVEYVKQKLPGRGAELEEELPD
ncbi:NrfD/PsrC family molybdoenzyme membrane anchor subunit [Chloroflexota bacterium]